MYFVYFFKTIYLTIYPYLGTLNQFETYFQFVKYNNITVNFI